MGGGYLEAGAVLAPGGLSGYAEVGVRPLAGVSLFGRATGHAGGFGGLLGARWEF